MIRCPDCPATWMGRKLEHCASCHETFTSTVAGDRHRVGLHGVSEGPERRRCADPAERGLVRNARGHWGLPGDQGSWWRVPHGQDRPPSLQGSSGDGLATPPEGQGLRPERSWLSPGRAAPRVVARRDRRGERRNPGRARGTTGAGGPGVARWRRARAGQVVAHGSPQRRRVRHGRPRHPGSDRRADRDRGATRPGGGLVARQHRLPGSAAHVLGARGDEGRRVRRGPRGLPGVFPTEAEHVNVHEHCLHLWGRVDGKPVVPR